MIKKAVLPAAGLGTRLYTAAKDQPKEMLPLPVLGPNNTIQPKPALQIIFEQLHNLGVREFCFVIGSSKEAVLKHFTPDEQKLSILEGSDDRAYIKEDLENFYEKLNNSKIYYVVQPVQRGFGDAVLLAENFVGEDDFWVVAGDTIITSQEDPYSHFKKILEVHERFKPAATISVERVENPANYGIVDGEMLDDTVMRIVKAVEKPKEPMTNLAITAVYIFNPSIFSALRNIKNGAKGKELQLTDGLDAMTRLGVYGILMNEKEKRYDLGSGDLYFAAVSDLSALAKKGIKII